MTSIGARLIAERKRVRKSQEAFGKLVGASRNTQGAYEKEPHEDGYSSPTLDYLIKVGEVMPEVDIHYIMFGTYRTAQADPHLLELNVLVKQMPLAQQAMGFAMLNMLQQTVKAGTLQDAEDLWRASRLFGQFFRMDLAGKEMVELAAAGALPAATEG